MLFAAGEIGQGEWKFGVADDAQVGLNPAFEDHGGFGVALGGDRQDWCLRNEEINEGGGIFRRNEKVDVTDDFFVASQASGSATANGIWMRAQTVDNADITNVVNTAAYAPSAGGTLYQATSDGNLAFQALPLAGNSQPHNNMQPYLTLNYNIALQGVFPPRG